MPISKVNLAYIANDSARKVVFGKRKSSLMKAANELSTLCGIEACIILFSPYDPKPNVWPSLLGAQHCIARFQNMSPSEQNRKMMNQQSFTKERIEKAKEKLMKLQQKNQHKEMTQVMYQCLHGRGFQHLTIGDLNNMKDLISQHLKDIDRRIEFLHQNGE